jgi:hypothetical protein
MFQRYTEKARRAVSFARDEARQFGSRYIETEHLLLGILREDKDLADRFLRSHALVESIREQVERHTKVCEKVSTSLDSPLSNECKRVLAYAAEEAERLFHKHIGTEHLLLGLLREEKCVAAQILHERGLRLSTIREGLAPDRQKEPHTQHQWPGAKHNHWMSGALQLTLFALFGLGAAKSAIHGRYLLVVAVVWLAVVLAWLRVGRSFSFLATDSRRNRFFVRVVAYALLVLYQVFLFGWIIILGVGIYRVTMR